MLIQSEDGIQWILRDAPYRDDLALNHHEGHLVSQHVGSGAVFIDIGAHVGKYALRASKTYQEVHAIEPVRENTRILAANVLINDLEEKVHIHEWAAWSSLHEDWDHQYGLNLVVDGANTSSFRPGEAIKVRCYPVDRLVGGNPPAITLPIECVKIDVEGAEVEVLDGMPTILQDHRPRLIIENHDHLFPDRHINDRLNAVLSLYDYRVDIVRWEQGDAVYWICSP